MGVVLEILFNIALLTSLITKSISLDTWFICAIMLYVFRDWVGDNDGGND